GWAHPKPRRYRWLDPPPYEPYPGLTIALSTRDVPPAQFPFDFLLHLPGVSVGVGIWRCLIAFRTGTYWISRGPTVQT
ncbi:hypothetical protein C7212DRAFT_311273, partial [Tuber magnatum]